VERSRDVVTQQQHVPQTPDAGFVVAEFQAAQNVLVFKRMREPDASAAALPIDL
jgi:hypothetical protein